MPHHRRSAILWFSFLLAFLAVVILGFVSSFAVIKGESGLVCVTPMPSGTIPGSKYYELDFPAIKSITQTTIYKVRNLESEAANTIHEHFTTPNCIRVGNYRPETIPGSSAESYVIGAYLSFPATFVGEIHITSNRMITGTAKIFSTITPVPTATSTPRGTAAPVYLPLVSNIIPTATPDRTKGDIRPPDLVSWNFSPVSVDTANSDQTITFTAHIVDDLSGVHYGIAWFYSPSGPLNHVWFFPSSDLVSGNLQDGIYVSTMTLNRFSATGVWRLKEIQLLDEIGNLRFLYPPAMAQRGLPVSFQVTNSNN
jgi:hypothetical protein